MGPFISSRTPEGDAHRCGTCGARFKLDPSRPPGDAPCPACGQLLWFPPARPPGAQPGVRVVSPAPAGIEFHAEGWRAGSLRARGAMADNLVRRGALVGLTRAEVEALLGPPDEERERCPAYVLWRGVRLICHGSPHRLLVRFRSDGRGSGAEVIELALAAR